MRIALTMALVSIFTITLATSAYAEGGKVRGEASTGPAYQLGEVPFTG